MSDIPFLKEIGLEVIRMEDGESEVALDLAVRHTNSWKVMHGGVTMTLLDVCMARAARSLDPESTGAATVELKVSFFQPGGKASDRMIARGRVLHQSTTMYYCEGEIWNGNRLVAKAMGTFKTIKRKDVARKMLKAV
ncbi:MAG: Thioesterase superfamily protein [Burkholderiaceae bacterium]|nr:Thioesterase superfamily protein [Burkholderiaceae bacterium]